MAATYSQLGQIAIQTDFSARVAIAMMSTALAVYSESSSTTGHAARAAYATKVLNGNYSLTQAVQAVLTNSTIIAEAVVTQSSGQGNGIPDSDIQFQVNAMWNALAGA